MKLRYNNVDNNLKEFRHASVLMTCSRGNNSITVPTAAITGEKLKAFSNKLVFDIFGCFNMIELNYLEFLLSIGEQNSSKADQFFSLLCLLLFALG